MFEVVIFVGIVILGVIYTRLGYNQHLDSKKIRKANVVYKQLSILIPCYNESKFLKNTISNLKNLKYPGLEIIFINNGSTDHSIYKLNYLLELEEMDFEERFEFQSTGVQKIYKSKKFENFYVIDKTHSNKTESLRAGIALANNDYIVTLSANSVLKRDALFIINMNLQDDDVIAVGGAVMIHQCISENSSGKIEFTRNAKFIELAQFKEYLATFLLFRNSMLRINKVGIISSDFGVYRKNILKNLNFFNNRHIGSIEMSVQLNEYAKKNHKIISYDDRAICFTEAESKWSALYKKRMDWQDCFIDIFLKHKPFVKELFLETNIFFVAFFSTIILGYIAVLILIGNVIEAGYLLLTHSSIGFDVYFQIVLSMIVLVIYSLLNVKVARQYGICPAKKGIIKLILVHLYLFIWFKPITIVIFFIGFFKFFFIRLYKLCKVRYKKS